MLVLLASGSLSFSLSFSASRVAEDELEDESLAAGAGTARVAGAGFFASFFAGLDFFARGAGEGEEGLRPELELSFSLSLEL